MHSYSLSLFSQKSANLSAHCVLQGQISASMAALPVGRAAKWAHINQVHIDGRREHMWTMWCRMWGMHGLRLMHRVHRQHLPPQWSMCRCLSVRIHRIPHNNGMCELWHRMCGMWRYNIKLHKLQGRHQPLLQAAKRKQLQNYLPTILLQVKWPYLCSMHWWNIWGCWYEFCWCLPEPLLWWM